MAGRREKCAIRWGAEQENKNYRQTPDVELELKLDVIKTDINSTGSCVR